MYSYYMFHKPYGCVSARRDDTFPTVIDYFKELNNPDLSPVGRLDRETEGLLLITVTEGRKHQVRRMLKTVGCCIIYLKRISMGEITLDESLKPGEWKEISIRKGYDSSES